MSVRIALLALLVTAPLAGCSFGTDGSPRSPERTLTPVPVESVGAPDAGSGISTPTRTPGTVPYDLPPGYGPRGVVDGERAAETQRRALENRTRYRLVTRSVRRRVVARSGRVGSASSGPARRVSTGSGTGAGCFRCTPPRTRSTPTGTGR